MARLAVAKKVYVAADGSESAHASSAAERLEFRFLGEDGKTVENVIAIRLSDFTPEMNLLANWHGFSQKIGDTYANAAKKNLDPLEEATSLYERLVGGDWVKERESMGPRPSLVVDAVVRSLINAGQEVNEDRKTAIVAKLGTKDERDAALANPTIKAAYEAIKAERAQAKAQAAATKAQGDETSLGDF